MMFLYHLFWTWGLLFIMPWALLFGSRRLRERLGLCFPEDLPKKGNIWIHALSVGEVLSAIPLVDAVRKAFPNKDIVFSVTTRSGMAVAKEKLYGRVTKIVYLPVDAWWCVNRAVRYANPAIFILVETDVWPALLSRLRKKKVPSLLVNGRISPRTLKSYLRAPFVVRRIFASFEACLMQTPLDRERLLKTGLSPEKVITVGNMKFDHHVAPMDDAEKNRWLETLGFTSHMQVWVSGSTHEGEEETLMKVFRKLKPDYSRLRLVVAPRKVERSPEILEMALKEGLSAGLKSEISDKKDTFDVVILNTLGELGRIFGLASIAFVGGSLVPIGGHNILEPAAFGVPVLLGPHTHNFEIMSEAILSAGGGFRVQDAEALETSISRLLENEALRLDMGETAKAFVLANQGALNRIMGYVKEML